MPRLLKRLLLLVGLPLMALAGGLVFLRWLTLRHFTPENVIHQLEASCNARVQLGGCSLSLFSSPARLELTSLHFHPRDAEADKATPTATRPPVKITHTYLRMGRAVVEADLAALVLRRELRVKTLLIETGDLKFDLLPSGESSLRGLFRAPATVRGQPNPALAAPAPVAAAAIDAEAPPPPAGDAGDAGEPPENNANENAPIPAFHARELAAPFAIDKISLVDARLRVRNRKSRAVTELNQLHLEVAGLAVDPSRLAGARPAAVSCRSRVWVDGGRQSPGRLAELQVRVQGSLIPFDAATGLLQPDFQFTTEITRGATLRSLKALEKIERNLARARRAGLKIAPFPTDAVLSADTTLPFRLHANTLALTRPSTLDFTAYALALDAGSAIDIATETHDVKAAWIAGREISDKALAGAQEFLGATGEEVARELRSLLIDPVVKNGRLHMEFTSKGRLAKPDVHITHPLQDLTDQLKEAGRGLIDSLKNN